MPVVQNISEEDVDYETEDSMDYRKVLIDYAEGNVEADLKGYFNDDSKSTDSGRIKCNKSDNVYRFETERGDDEDEMHSANNQGFNKHVSECVHSESNADVKGTREQGIKEDQNVFVQSEVESDIRSENQNEVKENDKDFD